MKRVILSNQNIPEQEEEPKSSQSRSCRLTVVPHCRVGHTKPWNLGDQTCVAWCPVSCRQAVPHINPELYRKGMSCLGASKARQAVSGNFPETCKNLIQRYKMIINNSWSVQNYYKYSHILSSTPLTWISLLKLEDSWLIPW